MVLLFSKNGGLGCRGGHSHQSSNNQKPDRPEPQDFQLNKDSASVIDLKRNEYSVLSESAKQLQHTPKSIYYSE